MRSPSLGRECGRGSGNCQTAGKVVKDAMPFRSRQRSEGMQEIMTDVSGLAGQALVQFAVNCHGASDPGPDKNGNDIFATGGLAQLQLAIQGGLYVVQ